MYLYLCSLSLQYVYISFSLPSVLDGWSQPHPLREVVWWKPDRVLAIGHIEGVDTVVEFNVCLDREKHSVEMKQSYV